MYYYCSIFRHFFYILITGQLLALLWTGFGVFATLLDNHTEQDISSTLAAGIYFVLAATCGPCMATQRNFVAKLKANWWKFLILGIADVQGAYLQVLGLRYTTVTINMVSTLFKCLYSPHIVVSINAVATSFSQNHCSTVDIS